MGQSIVIHGLIKKRAEIAGQHKAAVKAADAIKDDLAAIRPGAGAMRLPGRSQSNSAAREVQAAIRAQ